MIHLNITGTFAFNETLLNTIFFISKTLGSFLNIFTFFMILFCSAKDMKDYKIHLLFYQIASSLLDFLLDTLCVPIIFFPYTAGVTPGWFHQYLGWSPYHSCVAIFTYMSFALHFILYNMLFYRWQRILPDTSFLKIKGKKSLFFWQHGYLVFTVTPVPLLYSLAVDDIKVTRKEFKEKFPKDSNLADVEGFYFINMDKHKEFFYGLAYQTLWLTLQFVGIIFYNMDISRKLESLKNQMSVNTRKMHLRFMRMVFVQTMIPMLQMELPLFYWLSIVAFNVRYPRIQDVTTVTLGLITTHGAVGSIFLLCFNKCYRNAIHRAFVSILRNLCGKFVEEPRPIVKKPTTLDTTLV